MGLYCTKTSETYQLGIWEIVETEDELLSELPASCHEEVIPFRSEARRKERLAVRVLLKRMLGKCHEIAYYSSGKPYLVDGYGYISISHTKGFATVIFSKDREVGIDIECYSERVCKIKSRFINLEEEKFIDTGQEAKHLMICWCAKETLYKLIGEEQGTLDFKEHLHLHLFNALPSGQIQAYESRTKESAPYLLRYETHPLFIIVWCVK